MLAVDWDLGPNLLALTLGSFTSAFSKTLPFALDISLPLCADEVTKGTTCHRSQGKPCCVL